MHESIKSTDLHRISVGDVKTTTERKRPEDRKREQKIKLYTFNLKSKNISVNEFLMAMSTENAFPPYGAYYFALD